MKTLPRLFIATAMVAASLALTCTTAFASSNLVYSDEFNGPLSTATWSNDTPWNTHYTTGELEYYDPADCTFANGLMTLHSEKRASNGYAYTSGIVTSLKRTKFSYGYFEIRAKLPKGPGIWPAFWLTNDSTLEIDGLEMLGDRPTRIYQTLHRDSKQIDQGVVDGPDYSADFHTYAIDWQPTYVKWYIDGKLTMTHMGAIPSDPMYICLNTAVGGPWPGSPTAATAFPADFDIDYVRVYDTKPVSTTVPVASPDTYAAVSAVALGVAAPGPLHNDVADGSSLTASACTTPEHGTLALAPNGAFTYTPQAGFTGVDSFTYVACNGAVRSSPTVVTFNVAAKPTVVAKPRVVRKRNTRTSYSVSGSVHLGTMTRPSASTSTVLTIQVQRRVNGAWCPFRTVSKKSPTSAYKIAMKLRRGTFRARAKVTGGATPSGTSKWTSRVKVL